MRSRGEYLHSLQADMGCKTLHPTRKGAGNRSRAGLQNTERDARLGDAKVDCVGCMKSIGWRPLSPRRSHNPAWLERMSSFPPKSPVRFTMDGLGPCTDFTPTYQAQPDAAEIAVPESGKRVASTQLISNIRVCSATGCAPSRVHSHLVHELTLSGAISC